MDGKREIPESIMLVSINSSSEINLPHLSGSKNNLSLVETGTINFKKFEHESGVINGGGAGSSSEDEEKALIKVKPTRHNAFIVENPSQTNMRSLRQIPSY
mmetsp:Transcript_11519/g.9963  ORF Transcript_11519/g.9963 Transcript_11519/m.9963 type:complete len:101 (-) Transcript_11519:2059-2361(-)